MSASVHGEGGRPGLRWVLVAVVLFDLLAVLLNFFVFPPPDERLPWSPDWLFAVVDLAWPAIVLLVLATIATLGFARGKRSEPWFILLLLITMAILIEATGAYLGSHRRRYYSTGAALAGWLIGLVFARLRGADDARGERLAEAGAGAALTATYFNAGLQKVLAGGLLEVHSMQAHILTHHQIDDTSILGSLAYFVALEPRAAMALALTTVGIQVGSLSYSFGPRLRMLWGTLLICFHLGTLVFLHIIYVEATILLLAWSYPWKRIVARLRGEPKPAMVADDPPVAAGELVLLGGAAFLLVGVMWVVPTPHELPRPDWRREPDTQSLAQPQHDRGPGNTVTELGPLRVGDALGSWVIESIEIGKADARVHVVRQGQRASFGFSGPAGDAPEGPHSVGSLHIYYNAPEGTDLATLERAGEALREALTAGVEDPGASVDSWIQEARASLPKPQTFPLPL